ncbi:hypothetical protein [Paenibacillus sp. R14(2021)]|uniref:hypothetical protein n=1 Tax=Paenibacillus sp. R14(2021) TaxID=2859228 RepID=UPI001C616093|nr:hypothetical protein [Paenibacillus sp. R14(2021)]
MTKYKGYILAGLACLFLVLYVVWKVDRPEVGPAGSNIDPNKTAAKVQNPMPSEMPSNFDFTVTFGVGEVNKNEINTYDGTVTKDLITRGTATAQLALTLEEKRAIYAKMREVNIMGLQDLVPDNLNCDQTPYNEDSWQIRVNGETHTWTWSDRHCKVTKDAKQLLALRTFIQQMVENKEAYNALPEAEGGYD